MKMIRTFFDKTINFMEILRNIFDDIFLLLDRNRKDKENHIIIRIFYNILFGVIGFSFFMAMFLAGFVSIGLIVYLAKFFIDGGSLQNFILQ
tara:strand:- start:96 stop:371 length:276 start_codon:yes stop_codon:yes gene_type:complete